MSNGYDDVRIYQEIRPRRISAVLPAVLCFLCLCAALYAGLVADVLPSWSSWLTPLLMAVATFACAVIMPRNFTLGFLLALFPFLIAWRVGAMYNSTAIMTVSTIAFIVFLLQFFDCAASSMQRAGAGWNALAEWQITFLRIYFGFDMVGHFTEKLFAGYASLARMESVFATSYFISLSPAYVVLGGLCELAIAIGIGLGFITRLAAVGAALYYLIATVIGSHFLHGFGWLSAGGGWEYCMLMIVFFLSFVFTGGGRFSIDGWLLRRDLVPHALRFLFAPRAALKNFGRKTRRS